MFTSPSAEEVLSDAHHTKDFMKTSMNMILASLHIWGRRTSSSISEDYRAPHKFFVSVWGPCSKLSGWWFCYFFISQTTSEEVARLTSPTHHVFEACSHELYVKRCWWALRVSTHVEHQEMMIPLFTRSSSWTCSVDNFESLDVPHTTCPSSMSLSTASMLRVMIGSYMNE